LTKYDIFEMGNFVFTHSVFGDTHMPLTKTDLIQAVVQETGSPKTNATHYVNKILEIMKATLASGEDVLISGFGKFCVREKSERVGRNPATGNPMTLSARRVVTFKCSGKLREKCNK
jgi:integration host factor subunit alpha